MTPSELRQIRRTLEREIRMYSILGTPGDPPPLPRPVDGAAESEIGAALVCGGITVGDVPGLDAKHIEHPFHRVVFEVAHKAPVDSDGSLSIEFLENELRSRGHKGDLRLWLLVIRDEIPFRGRESCLAAAARLRELWRRRRILIRLLEIEGKLRIDAMSADDAIAELKAMVSKTLGTARGAAA
jgi:hypothetical protein